MNKYNNLTGLVITYIHIASYIAVNIRLSAESKSGVQYVLI